ncbi:MAG: maleylpyruvate isomerase family mycothiol-dependent enzyme [Ilumatobacteraceae bacterium]
MNAETSSAPDRNTAWYADRLAADGIRFTALIAAGDLDAPVAACPGWDVRRLVVHVGTVLGWAATCIADAAPPASMTEFEPGDRDLGEWFGDRVATIEPTIRSLDPAAPTWHPFPVERVAGVWPRRLTHELAMHRWDAEAAVGDPSPIDAELAADGIDEYFELAVPRLLRRDGVVLPTSSFHVHCTDVEGEWYVEGTDGEYRLERAHRKGDAALRGPAESLLLRLWGRPVADGVLDAVGDAAVLDDWLTLSGM